MTILKLRRDATAAQIARLHRHLAQARRELLDAARTAPGESRSPLAAASQDALVTLATRISVELCKLESPFMQRTADDAPFANPDDPGAWERWLTVRGL